MASRRRGRPTEQALPVTRTLHVRLTEAEHDALAAIAARHEVTVSRLIRRAVREMTTGLPEPFDEGLEQLARLAVALGGTERYLRHSNAASAGELARLTADVEAVRQAVVHLVQASRGRWAPVIES